MRSVTEVSLRILIVCILAFGLGTSVRAQYTKEYSAYLKADELNERSTLALKLWNPLMRNNLDSLKDLSFELLFAGVEEKNDLAIAAGKRGLGSYLIRSGEQTKGVLYLKQALEYFRKTGDPMLVTEILNEIGNGYYNMAQFRKAEQYYLKSLKAGKESPDPTDAFLAEINLGHVYIAMKNFDKAASVLQHYKNESLKNGKLEAVANAYALLGTIEQQRRNIPLAMEYFQKSADFGQRSNSRAQIAHAYNNLAIVYFEEGETDKTLEYFQKAMEMRKKTGNARYICESYFNIGGLYFELGKYQQAEEYYRKSLDLAREKHLKRDEMDAFWAFAELYKAKKDYTKALELMEEHALAQETYYADLSANNTLSVEMMQSIEEMEMQNRLDERDSEIEKMKVQQSNVWYVVYGIGALTSIVLLILLIFRKKIN